MKTVLVKPVVPVGGAIEKAAVGALHVVDCGTVTLVEDVAEPPWLVTVNCTVYVPAAAYVWTVPVA